ncbi:hypothetical protein [Dactylosporangium sp. CA-233914]|uniref:hypothetical protein n=1 Tax=Dactylosporangium sp. CA-233914 TaxID=3239934 RepID=UPI003D92EF12
MRMLTIAVAASMLLAGCAAANTPSEGQGGPAALRGFGVDVDAAVSARVPQVHLRTCGPWGCHEQDVPLQVAGPVSAGPCPSDAAPDTACGAVQLPGPGPAHGYAPVPSLTMDPVTVTVTTPPGAPLAIDAQLTVRPRPICPGAATGCAEPTPQAQIRIAADGSVSQAA